MSVRTLQVQSCPFLWHIRGCGTCGAAWLPTCPMPCCRASERTAARIAEIKAEIARIDAYEETKERFQQAYGEQACVVVYHLVGRVQCGDLKADRAAVLELA